jgi:protein-lysine N-methyltransferase EEF2KMT
MTNRQGVSDLLYTSRANLSRAEQTEIYKKRRLTYTPPTDFDFPATPVMIEEAQYLLGSASNVGLRTWEASLRLAHFLWNHQDLIRSRRVLELGAGTGFLSIFCSAALHAKQVIATDGNERVLESLQHNINLNHPYYGQNTPPVVKKLSWEDAEDFDSMTKSESGAEFKPDIVIGADITYHPDACKALASLLAKLARSHPACESFISVTVRDVKLLKDFVQRCESDEYGLKVQEVAFKCPGIHEQKGLFHTVAMPIRIFQICLSARHETTTLS